MRRRKTPGVSISSPLKSGCAGCGVQELSFPASVLRLFPRKASKFKMACLLASFFARFGRCLLPITRTLLGFPSASSRGEEERRQDRFLCDTPPNHPQRGLWVPPTRKAALWTLIFTCFNNSDTLISWFSRPQKRRNRRRRAVSARSTIDLCQIAIMTSGRRETRKQPPWASPEIGKRHVPCAPL